MKKEEIKLFSDEVVSRFYSTSGVQITDREAKLCQGLAVAIVESLLVREMLITTTVPLSGSRPGIVGDLIRKLQGEISTLRLDLEKSEAFVKAAFVAHPNLDLDVEGVRLGF